MSARSRAWPWWGPRRPWPEDCGAKLIAFGREWRCTQPIDHPHGHAASDGHGHCFAWERDDGADAVQGQEFVATI